VPQAAHEKKNVDSAMKTLRSAEISKSTSRNHILTFTFKKDWWTKEITDFLQWTVVYGCHFAKHKKSMRRIVVLRIKMCWTADKGWAINTPETNALHSYCVMRRRGIDCNLAIKKNAQLSQPSHNKRGCIRASRSEKTRGWSILSGAILRIIIFFF
jgi:hypothetical protein